MYTSREEDLSPVVTYRHARILTVSRILKNVNDHLQKLYEWKEKHRANRDTFVDVRFGMANFSLFFSYSELELSNPEPDDDIRHGMRETLRNLNWAMLSSYITFLEIEREGLIAEFNRLEKAQLPKEDGKKV